MTLDIDAIRKRADAATPGPWEIANGYKIVRDLEVTGRGSYRCTTDIVEVVSSDDRWLWVNDEATHPGTGDPDADLEFIAAARQDVDDLLAEVDRLRSALAGAETTREFVRLAVKERDYERERADRLIGEARKARAEVDRLRADNERLRTGIEKLVRAVEFDAQESRDDDGDPAYTETYDDFAASLRALLAEAGAR